MHGRINTSVATRREPDGELLGQRSAKRLHAQQSVVACRPQHGQRLAYPLEPSVRQGKCTGDGQADVGSIRPLGGGHRRHEGESRTAKRLATMGIAARECWEPVHPQEQAEVMETTVPSGQVSTENVMALLEHQQYRCALTGRSLTPQTAALDHIVPIRCGGEHVIENTQVLHKDVNRAKGSLTSEEFIGLCREVAQWSDHPTTRKESQ